MRRAAAILALGLALSATAPGPAAAAEKAIWGPVDHLRLHGKAFDLYRRLGVDTYQAQLNFATTAPTKPANPRDPRDPAYRWPGELDRAVSEGERTDIAVAIQVSRSPRWANGNRPPIWRPNPQAYADFLIAAARRYRSVRRWMIWGEPSRVAVYQPHRPDSTVGARSYAELLDAAYGALKGVSSRNIVIGGVTFTGNGGETNPARWLRAMKLPDGRPPRLDWYGHNPFSQRYPRIGDDVRGTDGVRDICDLDVFSREVARTYRRIGRRPKLWLSEYVIPSDHGSNVFSLYVSRRGQAQWLKAAYRVANALPSVAGLGWLALRDDPPSKLSGTFGLITSRGARKPAFFAYRAAPSRAFRPVVRAAGRISGEALAKRGLPVVVGARARGTIRLTLAGRDGRASTKRVARRVGPRRITLRSPRLGNGRYTLLVDAPRGERVRRRVIVD